MRSNRVWTNQTKGQVLPLVVDEAHGFSKRLLGLIPFSTLAKNEALYFPRCQAIHTFFMRFPIDCVFLTSSMEVVEVLEGVKPNRLTMPRWRAQSVLELAAGQARRLGIEKGDKLHVGH